MSGLYSETKSIKLADNALLREENFSSRQGIFLPPGLRPTISPHLLSRSETACWRNEFSTQGTHVQHTSCNLAMNSWILCLWWPVCQSVSRFYVVSIMVNNGFRKRRTMRWRTFRAPRVPCKAKRYRAKDFFTCSILENSGKRGICILLKKCRFGLPASNRPVSLQKLNFFFLVERSVQVWNNSAKRNRFLGK
jgi:hypothetical protein